MEGELSRARTETWVQNGQGHVVSGIMLSASIPRPQDTCMNEHRGTGLQSPWPLMTCRHRTECQLPHRCSGRHTPDPNALVTLSLLCCSSVPGTKKGNPLLLKILFKLSSPHPQRND